MGRVVAQTEVELSQFALIITQSSDYHNTRHGLHRLATLLGIPNYYHKLRQDLNLDKISVEEAVHLLLSKWKQAVASAATFINLVDLIEKCKWFNVAEKLCTHELSVPEGSSWSDLHRKTQQNILARNVSFMDRQETLASLLMRLHGRRFHVCMEGLSSSDLRTLLCDQSTLILGEPMLEIQPPYYTERKIQVGKHLHKSVFKKNIPDKFVFRGVFPSQLSELAGIDQPIDISDPTKDEYPTKFIVERYMDDFDNVRKVCDEPVHLVTYKDNKFFVMQPYGDHSKFLNNFGMDSVSISETSFMAVIDSKSKQHSLSVTNVIIAGSPGMGKTDLLSNLCRNADSEHLNIFISLSKLFNKPESVTPVKSFDSIVKIVTEHITKNKFGQHILAGALHNSNLQKNIFLDGYDEITPTLYPTVDKMLKLLQDCKRLKLYISTRLHKLRQLENVLPCQSYELNPFTKTEQVNILTLYWSDKHNIQDSSRVKQFAKRIVQHGMRYIDSNEVDFAGIPLQCTMLADIYSEDAERYYSMDISVDDFHVQTLSIYNLYISLVSKKTRQTERSTIAHIMEWHFKLSLLQLFPDRIEEIESALPTKRIKNLVGIINNIGIIQCDGNSSGKLTSAVFTHHSFAEFFVANWMMQFGDFKGRKKQLWKRILFENVLSPTGIWGENILNVGEGLSVRELYYTMIKHSTRNQCRELWHNIMAKLYMKEEEIRKAEIMWTRANMAVSQGMWKDVDYIRDKIYYMLYNWTKEENLPQPLSNLIHALKECGLGSVSSFLTDTYYKKDIALSSVAFLIDKGFNSQATQILAFSQSENILDSNLRLTFNSFHVGLIYESCMRHDYIGLFRFFTSIVRSDLKSFSSRINWWNILEEACRHASPLLIKELYELLIDLAKSEDILPRPLFTPLHIAAARGSFEIFDFLYKQLQPTTFDLGCIVHHCLRNSRNASTDVIFHKKEILSHLFQKHKSSFLVKSPEGDLPLHCESIHFDLMELVLNITEPNYAYMQNDKGETVAHCAARHLSPEDFYKFCLLMVNTGRAKLFSYATTTKFKPLYLALDRNIVDIETLHLLLKSGVLDLKYSPSYIFSAIQGGQSEPILRLLWRGESDKKKRSKHGQNYLHLAAKVGNVDGIKFLLEQGFSTNSKDNLKRTPLHLAFSYRNRNIHETVENLLDNQANPSAIDANQKSPLQYAISDGNGIVEERTICLLEAAMEGTKDNEFLQKRNFCCCNFIKRMLA